MEVKFDSQNRLQVTAVTAEEASTLMALAYDSKPQKKERADKGGTHGKHRKVRYVKACPVEGCDAKAKSIGLHMRMKHGILPDGEITETFKQATEGVMKVSEPVVSDGNGGYILKIHKNKSHSNFLGNTFQNGAVIEK